MSAEELKTLLSTPAALFLVMLLGSLASMLKQVSDAKKNGSVASLGSYLAHWPETLGTIITNALGFLTLVVTDQLNFASALGIGYAANSAADLLRSGGRSASLVKGQQSGFARPLLLVLVLAVAVPMLAILPGCATTSPQTQLILETTTRMAVRRSLVSSDRAVEKAANIRAVAERLQAVVTAESSIMGLRDEVMLELDKLNLDPLDRADAVDLVNLFAQLLQENYGDELAGDERMVKVRRFLEIVLSTLPA